MTYGLIILFAGAVMALMALGVCLAALIKLLEDNRALGLKLNRAEYQLKRVVGELAKLEHESGLPTLRDVFDYEKRDKKAAQAEKVQGSGLREII